VILCALCVEKDIMTLKIHNDILTQLHDHLESTYPEEGAGFLLGTANGTSRQVTAILPIENAREDAARHNRFLLTPLDTARAEDEADARGLTLVGIFHSHPDCPNVPSEFDREWALPWYSYTISRVDEGKAISIRSWRLNDDREAYIEEEIEVTGNS
jgi:proteasome lid subunit RPN8/RPN11